jgi:hypothetical protein
VLSAVIRIAMPVAVVFEVDATGSQLPLDPYVTIANPQASEWRGAVGLESRRRSL